MKRQRKRKRERNCPCKRKKAGLSNVFVFFSSVVFWKKMDEFKHTSIIMVLDFLNYLFRVVSLKLKK
jgi:hypothetical protein